MMTKHISFYGNDMTLCTFTGVVESLTQKSTTSTNTVVSTGRHGTTSSTSTDTTHSRTLYLINQETKEERSFTVSEWAGDFREGHLLTVCWIDCKKASNPEVLILKNHDLKTTLTRDYTVIFTIFALENIKIPNTNLLFWSATQPFLSHLVKFICFILLIFIFFPLAFIFGIGIWVFSYKQKKHFMEKIYPEFIHLISEDVKSIN